MVYRMNGTKPLYHKKLEKTIESEEKFMIRTKIVEIRETDLETANNLLKDPHWAFVTAVTDNNTQTVKYVLKRKGTYDDELVLLCQEKSQTKQTKSYQPTRGSEERSEFLYKFSKSTGERKSQ